MFHEDNTLVNGPRALCEVQGHVFAALMNASMLASALGSL
jgi:hypothetical protein